MPYAKLRDIDLYYETYGSGPPLVLAHGAGGNHLSWWQQVPQLARHFRLVIFDHRGFGESHDRPNGPGACAFTQDLSALLDHLAIDRVALLGQSMGGWTVCGFAVAHAKRITGLVLCGTIAGIHTAETECALKRMKIRSSAGLSDILKSAYAADFPVRSPELAHLYQQISALNKTVGKNLVSLLIEIENDVSPIVRRRVPTLLVVGEEDVTAPPEAMRSITTLIPEAQFCVVPGSGHSVYFERPAEFNRIVTDFLTQNQDRAPRVSFSADRQSLT